jgi:hypothetical protein
MHAPRRSCLVCCLLFLTAHRLPAPIAEETPTPSPTDLPKIDQMQAYGWPGEKFPETRTRLLKMEDITRWDSEKLRYAINEMYARGGYDFRIPEIKQIYLQFSWYRERLVNGRTQDEAYAHLSSLERTNLEFLQAVQHGK